jgi:hypothetical protein
MNKTLLLILCDFLLLNLLALTRWEKAVPTPKNQQPPVPEMSSNAVTGDQDLVETMRQSLADEKTARDQLVERLSSSESGLAAREQALTALQAERNKLATERANLAASLTETQKTAAELNQKAAAAAQEATMTREQLAQLQRELADRQAEAERQKQALAALEKQHADAQKRIEGLTTAVAVSEQEKKTLRETAETLKNQVEVERADRLKVQETTTQLAQGVGQLAEKSTELTKEIRDNRPVNANTLYNDFLNNSVQTTFTANRHGLLHQVQRTAANRTVLVTDGKEIYALLHISDTPFSIGTPGTDWEKVTVDLSRSGGSHTAAETINFLAIDPRVVVLPVTAEQVSAIGGKVYPLAVDPFKFPEAVLISSGAKGYGEVGFKLDVTQPGYVRVDNRLFKRLFGDFAPSAGDLVFSKTGELLGIMVNSDYCAVLGNFSVFQTIHAGDDVKSQTTSRIFEMLDNRYRSLPQKLQ